MTYHHSWGSALLSATRTPPFRRPEESVIIWNPLMDVLLDSFVSTVSGCSIKNSDIHWPNELLCHRRGQHHEALSNSKLHFTPACRTTASPGSLRVLRVLRINHRVISYASNVTSTPMCSKVCSSSIRMDGRLVDCFQNYFFSNKCLPIIIAGLQEYRYRCWRRNILFLSAGKRKSIVPERRYISLATINSIFRSLANVSRNDISWTNLSLTN